MKAVLISICLVFLSLTGLKAQYRFSGQVTNEKGKGFEAVQVLLTAGDSLVAMTLTDGKGQFRMEELKSGEYEVHIHELGYSSVDEKLFVRKRDIKMDFVLLPEMTGELKEVEVTANRSERVDRTATGQIFYLSEKAKNSGNAYRALKEIPKLIINESNQQISMTNGSSVLILINGNKVNSGVNPIDPKEIESVEVVDVVSARYLKDGVRHIVNIKLKKKADPYRFFEVMNRHDMRIRNGSGAIYFEVGNPQYSLYGRGATGYTYNDDTETESFQQNTGYQKAMNGIARNNKRYQLGELQFRWMPTDKDYIVAHVYENGTLIKDKTWGDGWLEKEEKESFDYASRSRDKSYILTGSLFHKHTFAPENTLETTFAYNKNHNRNQSTREEIYPDWLYDNYYEYKNNRSSYNLTIDYSYTWNETNSLNVGSETNLVNDRIHQISDGYPVFRHREWTEYLYAGFTSKVKKFYYMLSAGVEGLWLKAGDADNHYFKPRASVSGTYKVNDSHSFQVGYTLTNTPPSVHSLNPYNTSTDSLVISRGNPYLLPAQVHQLDASYTFNKKGLYITPSVGYEINTDIIEPTGYTENGIYTSTYRNSDKYKELLVGSSLSYRWNRFQVYGGLYHRLSHFTGQEAKKSFMGYIGFSASYKKFSFYGYCDYTNYAYTAVSRTRNYAPTFSQLQVTYNFTPLFYISVALENGTGMMRTATTTRSDGYYNYNFRRMKDQSFCPWILIRYTFRKNVGRKIKENKLVKPKEQGISL